ncbi:hypothetical protein PRK78_003935 [Emydomyces testavorans]|uniref:Major facilitator superfamily (MFS) profile domain-containing protein n=1 Tax=Emydomyces testavorans TaxID=2070801 RepID=A0AAF0IJ13_9EURO|nr:hypothetical protein PRK78_003935 [Emydomyces testavorans]
MAPELMKVSSNPPLVTTSDGEHEGPEGEDDALIVQSEKALERRLLLKVDLRLCTIAGVLCSLNLIDSGIISSAAVTTMISDLSLQGNRYSVSIFIFTVSSIVFQLPSTLAIRFVGPRTWDWKQMIVLRVLLGISMSGVYPGVTYLISTWYTRREQQLRYAFMQSAEVVILATGSILNYALNHLDGTAGFEGWRWMFLIQGLIACAVGIVTYWWMIDFPDNAHQSFWFLNEAEIKLAIKRIEADRHDAIPDQFSWSSVAVNFLDFKLYGFSCLYFLLNVVSTSLSYFLPIILQSGMGFSTNKSILLSSPPYYYAVIPVLLTSLIGDRYRLRGPLIAFNALCLIAGFLMLGLPASKQVTVRYVGTFLATGAYVSNWAALNAYQANNIVGQWKRATVAAAATASNGLGGIAGSFIVRSAEAPTYTTAVWVSIG